MRAPCVLTLANGRSIAIELERLATTLWRSEIPQGGWLRWEYWFRRSFGEALAAACVSVEEQTGSGVIRCEGIRSEAAVTKLADLHTRLKDRIRECERYEAEGRGLAATEYFKTCGGELQWVLQAVGSIIASEAEQVAEQGEGQEGC